MAENENATVQGANANLEGQQQTNTGAEPGEKTYSQADVDKMLQSEADKRVTEALKTAQAKWEEDLKKRIDDERKEAEKLAKMTAQEKAEAQLKKDREEFEKQRQELQRERMEIETRKILRSEELDENFAPFLMNGDADATKTNIDTFKKAFVAAVEEGVKKQLKGKTPSAGEQKSATQMEEQLKNIFGF